jgi:transposase
MAKKNQQAKKMAAAGKSAAQIKAKTGVGSQTAQKYVAKQAPAPAPAPAPKFSGQVTGAAKEAQSAKVQQTLSTPQVGQRPGQVATVYAPDVTPPSQAATSHPALHLKSKV